MRALAFLAVSLISFCATAQEAASLHGQVIDSTTGKPLSRVHIRLMATSLDDFIGAVYGALSDEAGQFSISPIAPGTYLIQPQLAGYFLAAAATGQPSSTVTIKPGAKIEALQIAMAPRAIVTGRVLTETGEPTEYAYIHFDLAEGGIAQELAREFQQWGEGNIHTNSQGEYRLSVPAGKYYITAQSFSTPEEIRPDGAVLTPFTYAITYYPNADNRKASTVVDARAGQETSGVDIHLVRKKTLGISGFVSGIPAGNTATVHLGGRSNATLRVEPDGRFSAEGLEPGTYNLKAVSGSGEDRLSSALIEVGLEADLAAGIELALRPLFTLTGIVELATGGPPGVKAVLRLRYMPDGETDIREGRSVAVDAYGKFELSGLEPRRYGISLLPLAEDSYVRSVRLDGHEIEERAPDISANLGGEDVRLEPVLDLRQSVGSPKLRIVVDRGGASLSGMVEGKAGPVTNGFGVVVLAPAGAKSWEDVISAKIAKDGTYVIHGIPPGKYRLLADDLLGGSASDSDSSAPPPPPPPPDDDAFQTQLARAAVIELHAGDRLTKNLKTSETGDDKKL